ncbi:hypothetical protein KC337_g42 [Hortaea werneckii]|nr:hypothetical protein KC337_g42 [Hortaea werneckii]
MSISTKTSTPRYLVLKGYLILTMACLRPSLCARRDDDGVLGLAAAEVGETSWNFCRSMSVAFQSICRMPNNKEVGLVYSSLSLYIRFLRVRTGGLTVAEMHLQTQEGTGPAADAQVNGLESLHSTKSTSLPFGQNINLSSVSGPTYLTAQTLVQQVAYALSDKLFSYSPQSFDLDVAAKAWKLAGEKNAHGDVTGVQALDTRHGVGNIALGYMFSPDFNLNKRHVPQSIIASAGMLQHLRPALDQLRQA